MKQIAFGALLLLIVGLVAAISNVKEHYTDPESPVTRPELNGVWKSKIESQAPLGANDEDYIKILQLFYDKVYQPSDTKPKDSDIEAFLNSPAAAVAGVDRDALRKIIADGFHAEHTEGAASREKKEIAFEPDEKLLQPNDGVDEVFVRKEEPYKPADSRVGKLPEGQYAPVPQQKAPRNSGEYDDHSTSWHAGQFSAF
jgi:hypothetical protein